MTIYHVIKQRRSRIGMDYIHDFGTYKHKTSAMDAVHENIAHIISHSESQGDFDYVKNEHPNGKYIVVSVYYTSIDNKKTEKFRYYIIEAEIGD